MDADLKDLFLKEVDLIQAIITRMAHNSFLIKGWTLTLIVGTLVIQQDAPLLVVALPLITFWLLDAFFLHQEKIYRALYDWVIVERPEGNKDYLLDMAPQRREKIVNEVDHLLDVAFSKTLLPFYGTIAVIVLIMWWFVD